MAPAGLNPESLTTMLRDVLDGGSVRDVRISPVGTGQVADCFRCELDLDGAGPSSVVAKVAAASEQSRNTAAGQRLYEREVGFYRHFAEEVEVRTPRAFHAEFDRDQGDFVLLLEDMTPAAEVDQLHGFTAEHARLALTQLAGLHGPMWGRTEEPRMAWLRSIQDELSGGYQDLLPVLLTEFLTRYDDALSPVLREVIEGFRPRQLDYLADRAGPWTLQHSDFRPDNMLFDGQGGAVPLAIVDWQSIAAGPGLVDVSYLLGTSLDGAERARCERELVSHYHQALVSHGVSGFSPDECWRSYRLHSFHALSFLTCAAVLVERTERGDRMFLTMLDRVAAQIAELDALELLG